MKAISNKEWYNRHKKIHELVKDISIRDGISLLETVKHDLCFLKGLADADL